VQVSVGGQTRVGHLHVPPGYAPTRATPLVVNFHGYTDDGAKQDALSKMNAKSDAAGFLAVEPDGIDNSWNAGACCGNAVSKKVDDVAFVAKLLDAIQDKACVDPKRIFATGMSNGGFLSHRLGCEMADRFAAIAPVAGVMGVSTCNPTRRMPVMEFHGTSDPVVPYGGNAFINYPSVDTTIKGWADRGGCATTTKEIFRKGDAHCVTYDGCKDGVEVTLCTIDGGGHTWPGGTGGVGKISTDLSATDAMWDFFQKHPLP
jgi:polyhydroxybutyrate depolymerase